MQFQANQISKIFSGEHAPGPPKRSHLQDSHAPPPPPNEKSWLRACVYCSVCALVKMYDHSVSDVHFEVY